MTWFEARNDDPVLVHLERILFLRNGLVELEQRGKGTYEMGRVGDEVIDHLLVLPGVLGRELVGALEIALVVRNFPILQIPRRRFLPRISSASGGDQGEGITHKGGIAGSDLNPDREDLG